MMEFQFYWPNWWKIWPWVNKYEADENGPAEVWFGMGPFQFRKYLWRSS